MTDSIALDLFADLWLRAVDTPLSFVDGLRRAGFSQAARRDIMDEDGSTTALLLFTRPRSGFAFSCTLSDTGLPGDGAVLLPDTPQNQISLRDFILDQPGLTEVTEDTRYHFAFAPESVSWQLVDSRFWTSKAPGMTGINFSLGPAFFAPFDDGPAIALTAGANIALQDPLTPQALNELTGPGSRLAKFVLIFSEIATKACPDLEKLIWAANAYGFEISLDDDEPFVPDGRPFIMGGGYGPNPRSEDHTSSIHVNCDTPYDFEFALGFILDERLTPDIIQSALFSHLGISEQANADRTGPLQIGEDRYLVRHMIQSATFGNHYFVLQR